MTQRTIRSTVRFHRGFTLRPIAGPLPPGIYTVETIEERIEEASFDAHRRMATTLFLPAGSLDADVEQFVTIDPLELASALQRDALSWWRESGATVQSPDRKSSDARREQGE